jgi:hypothetical protein
MTEATAVLRNGTPPAPAAPRRRRLLRSGWVLLACAWVGTACLLCDRWQQQRAWEEACAEADRLDPGWRWDDLAARPPLPAERDSAAHVRAALNLLPDRVKQVRRGPVPRRGAVPGGRRGPGRRAVPPGRGPLAGVAR